MTTTPHPPIRIQFRRSGGFAGIPLTATTSADELSDEHAAQVQSLLVAAEPRQPGRAAPGGADLFQYQLNLDDGQRHRSFAWDETQVPAAIRPVLDALTRLARPG
jgi:Emfourin